MKVSVAFLGGVGEIGMNFYVYESETTAFVVDCGVKFAGGTEPGIDLIIPDFSYLKEINHKLKYIVVTHAHEDHGGAVSFLLNECGDIPIAADRYTMGLVDRRLKENSITYQKTFFEPNTPLEIGDFAITFIPLSHSVHGTGALLIKAADGFTALHISDYKIDFSPITSDPFPMKAFAEIGKNGLNCLLADSTNCTCKGFTPGEALAAQGLEKVFKNAEGRIFFTTFSSNTERLQTVFDLAEKYGRAVIVEGSSLLRNVTHARTMGKLKINDKCIVKRKFLNMLPDEKICVIATGSQGEKESVISKISANDYSIITIHKNDTFIFSSRIIPGNESNIIMVMNRIIKAGGICVTANDENVHVSGHASEMDVALLIKLTAPDYLIPIHGEYIHMRRHKEIAVKECSMDESRVILSCEGEKLTFTDGVFTDRCEVPWGKRFVDAKGGFILNMEQLKLRKRLASEGAVFICAEVNLTTGSMTSAPIIATAGFEMEKTSSDDFTNFILKESTTAVFERFNSSAWQEQLNKLAKKYFKKTTGRRPIITITLKESS